MTVAKIISRLSESHGAPALALARRRLNIPEIYTYNESDVGDYIKNTICPDISWTDIL
jgi:hypothetical protein